MDVWAESVRGGSRQKLDLERPAAVFGAGLVSFASGGGAAAGERNNAPLPTHLLPDKNRAEKSEAAAPWSLWPRRSAARVRSVGTWPREKEAKRLAGGSAAAASCRRVVDFP